MKERKHEAPPRYDAAFKEGAIRLVAQEGRPMREAAQELGVCVDTIRNWLRALGSSLQKWEREHHMEHQQSGDSFDFCVLFRVYFFGKGAIFKIARHSADLVECLFLM